MCGYDIHICMYTYVYLYKLYAHSICTYCIVCAKPRVYTHMYMHIYIFISKLCTQSICMECARPHASTR